MTFKDIFNEYFKNCDYSDEWVYSKFTDVIAKDLSPLKAFELIPEVVDVLLEQSDHDLKVELLELVVGLAGETGTTEIPNGLLSKFYLIEKLVDQESNYVKSQFSQLKRWYRM
jgi:hypothetical protein